MAVQFILFNFANLLLLRFLPYLSRVFSASKKNRCYFCDFLRYIRRFGALLGFFFFQVQNFVKFVIFAIFVTDVFRSQEKSLLLLRFFAIYAAVWGPSWFLLFLSLEFSSICYFLAIFAIFVTGVFSSQEKSLLLLRFLRYLRTFSTPSQFLLFLSLEFC